MLHKERYGLLLQIQMSIFCIIWLVDQSKPCTQIYLQKIVSFINLQLAIRISKNHAFRTCTTTSDIQAEFEIDRPIRYQITAKRNYFHKRPTDGQIRHVPQQWVVLSKIEKYTKNYKTS